MKSTPLLRLLPSNPDTTMQNEQHQSPVTFAYDSDLGPGRFVQVRSDFLCCPLFSPLDKLLYMVLCYRASLGARSWPSHAWLARVCDASEDDIQVSLEMLRSAGLISTQQSAKGGPAVYFVHKLPAVLPGKASILGVKRCNGVEIELHIPQSQSNKAKQQIADDIRLLVDKVGISREIAEGLVYLVAERGCSEGYVAQVVEYATTTPGIKNPAGCVVELIRRNERRRPTTQTAHQHSDQTLDLEKYTSGKYSFLFRPQGNTESTGETARTDDNERTEES